MTQRTIIITMDYELPGNGTGDVRQLMIKPTDDLIKILEANKINMTVFFEIEEFLVFQKYSKMLEENLGYNPAYEIELQVNRLVDCGHEIGLHIHPQWIGAKYVNGKFLLTPENQSLTDVYNTEEELSSFLENRVAALTKLVNKYDSCFKLTSYRAGGHALRPEGITLKILGKLGVRAESSVVSGLYKNGAGICIDYRDAPQMLGYWRVRDNVCRVAPDGEIIEFPVYSKIKPEYKKLTINRIKTKFFSSDRPMKTMRYGVSRMDIPNNPWGLLRYLCQKNPLKFDFCHMSITEMISFLDGANNQQFPLTMIGHSKEFFNTKYFSSFIKVATKQKQASFVTMANAVKNIEDGLV